MPLTIDSSNFSDAMRRLASLPAKVRKEVLNAFGEYMQGELEDAAPWKGSRSDFDHKADPDRVVIGTRVPWGRIRHYGGEIHAGGHPSYRPPKPPLQSRAGKPSEVTGKPPRYLAIPIDPEARKNKKRPRDYAGKGTFVFRSKNGNLLIGQRADSQGRFTRRSGAATIGRKATSSEGGIRLLFVLKESVTIKPTRYADIQPRDRQTFADAVTDAMGETLTP